MKKNSYRKEVLQKLKNFSKDEKECADKRLVEQLLSSPVYQGAQTIATYLNLPHEVATSDLIARALADGKRVVVPKVLNRTEMIFVSYDPDQLEPAAFGILQPSSHQVIPKTSIDLIHVPGVVFDTRGYRIGYGGGYYDRYLADYEGHTMSTAYACQMMTVVPEPYDIPVKELLIDDPTQASL